MHLHSRESKCERFAGASTSKIESAVEIYKYECKYLVVLRVYLNCTRTITFKRNERN